MVIDGRPAPFRPGSRRPDDAEGARRLQGGLPPHDIGAEEAVLAAMLLDDEAYARVLSILQPEDFFREQNRWCYEAAQAVALRGEPITVATVAHDLERAGRLDASGGEAYLLELASKYFTA